MRKSSRAQIAWERHSDSVKSSPIMLTFVSLCVNLPARGCGADWWKLQQHTSNLFLVFPSQSFSLCNLFSMPLAYVFIARANGYWFYSNLCLTLLRWDHLSYLWQLTKGRCCMLSSPCCYLSSQAPPRRWLMTAWRSSKKTMLFFCIVPILPVS